ncbi:hypothetical protein ACJX0J_009977, partial [Zea mays]
IFTMFMQRTMLNVVATFFFLVGYSGKDVESVIYKLLEVLDKHLSMVQRDNEQKSHIVERQIKEYLPNLVQILRTILQFYVRGGFRLEEDAIMYIPASSRLDCER